jgi:hypothetical protein
MSNMSDQSLCARINVEMAETINTLRSSLRMSLPSYQKQSV